MNFKLKRIYFISFNLIILLFLMGCSSHKHSLKDYEYDEHLHWRECEICHEKEEFFYHTFSPWTIVVAPTETEEGLRRQVCSACGFERTDIVSPVDHKHQYGAWEIVVEPTKTLPGKIQRVCELNDQHIESETLPILNPTSYRHQIVTEANCDREGEETYTYYKNGQILQISQILPKTDHTYELTWSKNEVGHWHASICSHEGLMKDFEEHLYYNGFCSVCEYKEPEEEHIHQFGKWEIVLEPTTTSIGELKRTCLTNENHIERKELPALNTDSYSYFITKESTCSEKGKAEYKITIDEEEFIFEIMLPFSDHSYSNEWSTNNQYHWHSASCDHYDQRKDYEEHSFENGRCKICGYIGYSEGLIYELNEDLVSYCVLGVGTFKDKNLVVPGEYQGLPVTKINYSAFKDCTYIETVRILANVEELGDSCFQGCTNLKTIEFPESLKKIGNNCFTGCSKLEEISLPDNVEFLGDSVFKNCSQLKTIKFSTQLNSIGSQIVQDCSNLVYNEYDTGLYLGNEENPYLIFVKANDPLISSCSIHEETKFISSSAFAECSSIKSIVIPSKVISLGNSSFNYCTSLEYIIIGKEVQSIGRSAFAGCNQLKYVYYMGSKEEWDLVEIGSNNPISNLVYYYNEEPSTQREWAFDENQMPVPVL